MRNRESFNEAAQLYDEVRPSYPDELIDWIIEKSHIDSKKQILEIAPGTGQCTKKFVERNFKVHAVELGDKLADLLQANMKGKQVTVDVSSFENWTPSTNHKYPLIYCATAWHWIDPKVKYKKTSDLLENDGRLAIIWNNALGISNQGLMDQAYELLFSYYADKPHSSKPKNDEEIKVQDLGTKKMLEESGHFIIDGYFEKTWSVDQTKEKLIKGFYSQSSYLSLDSKDRFDLNNKLEAIFNQLDHEIKTTFKSVVYLLKKRSDSFVSKDKE